MKKRLLHSSSAPQYQPRKRLAGTYLKFGCPSNTSAATLRGSVTEKPKLMTEIPLSLLITGHPITEEGAMNAGKDHLSLSRTFSLTIPTPTAACLSPSRWPHRKLVKEGEARCILHATTWLTPHQWLSSRTKQHKAKQP